MSTQSIFDRSNLQLGLRYIEDDKPMFVTSVGDPKDEIFDLPLNKIAPHLGQYEA